MKRLRPPLSVKIITGFIFSDPKIFDKTKTLLSKRFGPIDLESETRPFNHTHYYNHEMGLDLKRRFLSFRNLRTPEDIYRLKLFTNNLEERFSISGKRQINIDPGYLTLSKLILLTTKDYTHRVYLKDGIYAEVALFYKDRSYRPWEWTYPDYKIEYHIDFFNQVREAYIKDLKER